MSKETSDLATWAKTTDWENHLKDNPAIKDSLQKIRNAIEGTGDDEEFTQENRIKLVVVGDGAVGKTSLLIRYRTGEFPTEYVPTVFENATATLTHNEKKIFLSLWDTAGQEEYDRLRPLSYPSADVVLLCFSTISPVSFEKITEKWAPEIDHYLSSVPHILVGTKKDLREAKFEDPQTKKFSPISTEQGQKLAKEIKCAAYMEISSKTGEGVNEVMQKAAELVLAHRSQSMSPDSGSTSGPKVITKEKKKSCLIV